MFAMSGFVDCGKIGFDIWFEYLIVMCVKYNSGVWHRVETIGIIMIGKIELSYKIVFFVDIVCLKSSNHPIFHFHKAWWRYNWVVAVCELNLEFLLIKG